jgi:tetratricopeptide (TPR) repeat protein
MNDANSLPCFQRGLRGGPGRLGRPHPRLRQCHGVLSGGGRRARSVARLAYCDAALAEDNLALTDRADTLVNRGILYMKKGALQAAIADFDAASAEAPDLAEAYVNKGILRLNTGDNDSAVRLLTQALALSTREPEVAYYGRGLANEMLGNIAAAYADYRTAVQLRPQWREPREELRRFRVGARPSS